MRQGVREQERVSGGQFRALIETMRPKQWIPKNGIVFASLVFSNEGLLLSPSAILRAPDEEARAKMYDMLVDDLRAAARHLDAVEPVSVSDEE